MNQKIKIVFIAIMLVAAVFLSGCVDSNSVNESKSGSDQVAENDNNSKMMSVQEDIGTMQPMGMLMFILPMLQQTTPHLLILLILPILHQLRQLTQVAGEVPPKSILAVAVHQIVIQVAMRRPMIAVILMKTQPIR
jgi:hypothetical protein